MVFFIVASKISPEKQNRKLRYFISVVLRIIFDFSYQEGVRQSRYQIYFPLSYNKDRNFRSCSAYVHSKIVNYGSYERYLTQYEHTMGAFLILLFFLSLWLKQLLSKLLTALFHPIIPFEQKRKLLKRKIFRHCKKCFRSRSYFLIFFPFNIIYEYVSFLSS